MIIFYCLADIGELVVLMAKRRYIQNDNSANEESNGSSTRRVVSINQKMICHVFESDEVSTKVLWLLERWIWFLGSIDCSFYRSSISSSLCRIFKSQWNWWSEFYTWYWLSRSAWTTRNRSGRIESICEERMSKRGKRLIELSYLLMDFYWIGNCNKRKKWTHWYRDCRKWLGINVTYRCYCQYDAGWTCSKVCFDS